MRRGGALAACMLLLAAGAAGAQEAPRAAAATHRVRVLDIRVPARGRALTHTHPTGYVEVAMTDCHLRFTYPGGKTSETTLHAGDSVWNEPVTHSIENLGPGECHVLNIEPKEAQAAHK